MKFYFVNLIISVIFVFESSSFSNINKVLSLQTCYSKDGNGCSIDECDTRNSTCQIVVDDDMLYCGCIYCNYDSNQQQCVGLCTDRKFSQCIARVSTPKADQDCGCYKCETNRDEMGNAVCSGQCFNSSLVCKPKLFSTMTGPEFYCHCQNSDILDPDQNYCRYRASVDSCVGKCENGSSCISDGSFHCKCNAN